MVSQTSARNKKNIWVAAGDGDLERVQTVEVARYLVEKGATPGWQNQEGETPADKLEDDFPEISAYLRSIAGPVAVSDPMAAARTQQPSQYATEQTAEQLTSGLIAEVQTIMEQAEREGKDPQEDLQRVVGDALLASARAGQGLGGSASQENDEDEIKRTRLNGNDS
ncbi:hypothetical protein FRB99_002289 [Tulasnella sp. 403]|nr:hypothetical protein FRB99_002289 [Tulasnella sp. 403]